MNDIQINPNNLQAIVIQYKSNSVYPFAMSNNTNIFVQLTNSQQVQIGLQEILPYINVLKAKADALNDGSVVIATQGENDDGTNYDRFTVIKIGQPLSVTTPFITIVNAPASPTLNGIVNVSSVLGNIVNSSNSPSIISFQLPTINSDFFENDYNFTITGSPFFAVVQASGAGTDTWNVTVVLVAGDPNINTSITFTAKELRANLIIRLENQSNWNQINAITGFVGILKAVNGAGYISQSDLPSGGGALAAPLLGGQMSAFRYIGNEVAGTIQINGDFTVSSAQDMNVDANGGNRRINTTTNVPVSGNQDINCDYEFFDNGQIPTVSRYLFINCTSGGGTPVPPMGVAVTSIAQATDPTGICTGTTATYYTDDGTISTGQTVYTDAALTTPLAGADFIVGQPDGLIYAIDNVTGVVGIAVGGSCIPPLAKNVFVVNNSGQPIVITTSQGTQAFAPAMNGNIGVAAGDTIQNDSITTRTFTAYKQPPFIVANKDPDISPNPFTLVSGGTKVLSNDITNLNYLIVT